jgi:hypothetical protein
MYLVPEDNFYYSIGRVKYIGRNYGSARQRLMDSELFTEHVRLAETRVSVALDNICASVMFIPEEKT